MISSVTEFKTMQHDLSLSHHLNSLLNYSVSCSWTKAVEKYFIVMSGHVLMRENLLVKGVEFMITGVLGLRLGFPCLEPDQS